MSTTPTDSVPEWVKNIDAQRIARIEQFKRPQHEIGKGSKCLKCGDGCEGLDLHFWRKVCKNCRCPAEEHDVRVDVDPIIRKIGKLFDPTTTQQQPVPVGDWQYGGIELPPNQTGIAQSEEAVAEVYEWVPAAESIHLVQRYMGQLPKDKQPIRGTEGATYRKKQLERQLPNHDMDPNACHDLTDSEVKKLNDFVDTYKKDAIGIGQLLERPQNRSAAKGEYSLVEEAKWSCAKCRGTMHPGDVAVFAERAGSNSCWHPSCFVCATCNELLVDLIYFYKDGNIFCGRHFADTLKARCAACDELIFAKEYTQAEGQNWHLKHFCCWHCDEPLGGQRYVAKDGKPYCLLCYQNVLAKVCHACNKKIAAEAQRLSYGDMHWHATTECFNCAACHVSLIDKKFMCKQGMIFCSVECKRSKLTPSSYSHDINVSSTNTVV